MAKDPRFNFYVDNWIGGTKRMTLEQKGGYIELLILNFYCLSDGINGFTEAEAVHTLASATAPAAAWEFLKPKFIFSGGLYCNERMLKEFNKSKQHSEKQSNKAKKRWKGDATAYAVEHAFNGTGNENGKEIEDEIGIPEHLAEELDKHDLDFSLVPFYMFPGLALWLKHKSERRQKYKQTGFNVAVQQWQEKYPDASSFEEAVKHSMSNNWAGLFAPNTKQNGKNTASDQRSSAVTERKNDFGSRK